MRNVAVVAVLALAVLPLQAAEKKTFELKADATGAPAGWTFGRTGQGKAGRWVVEEGQPLGAAGSVLVQRDADETDYRFPMAFAPGVTMTDGTVKVRCRPLSGKVDQACGVILRARGEKEYVIARANALENNVRLYNVTDGNRKQFASWSGEVKTGAWHTLSLSAAGSEYVVAFDGKEVMRATSDVIKGAGGAGLWTKADSVTAFDAITVEIAK